jgi:hypothetical protein
MRESWFNRVDGRHHSGGVSSCDVRLLFVMVVDLDAIMA